MIKHFANTDHLVASNTNQYNQVAYDLIQFEDAPTAPLPPPSTTQYHNSYQNAEIQHIPNKIYPSISTISHQDNIIEHEQVQMAQQPTTSYQSNLNENDAKYIKPIHHCFINDNGVAYQHIIIPSPNLSHVKDLASKKKIPICYIGFHCLFLITLSIVLVVMQAMLKYFGAGIWSGLFSILTATIGSFLGFILLNFLIIFHSKNYNLKPYLVCNQNRCVIFFSVITHILNMIVISAGLVVTVINILDVDCFINYKQSCNNNEEFILYCGILVDGLLLVIINLMFILFLTVKLNGCCCPPNTNDNDHILHSHQILRSNDHLINPTSSTSTRYQSI